MDTLLRRDPLADAEKITGRSYKDDDLTSGLGLLMHLDHVQKKERALKGAGDSYYNMNLADTLALYADLGFEEVLVDEFVGTGYGEEPPAETYRVLWHPDGLLATVESYRTTDRNHTKVYYNLRITDRENYWDAISSGSHHDGVWVGDHDGREGIARSLERLREVGEFLPVWEKRPFLRLVDYSESKVDGYDREAITAGRISRLPARVQAAIAGGA